jgi:L-aminopeptidase/D-esterase-like protein
MNVPMAPASPGPAGRAGLSTAEPGQQLAGAGPMPDSAPGPPPASPSPFTLAVMDATAEAILNSLCIADTTAGFRGHVRPAVPVDRVRRLCAARTVLAAGN